MVRALICAAGARDWMELVPALENKTVGPQAHKCHYLGARRRRNAAHFSVNAWPIPAVLPEQRRTSVVPVPAVLPGGKECDRCHAFLPDTNGTLEQTGEPPGSRSETHRNPGKYLFTFN